MTGVGWFLFGCGIVLGICAVQIVIVWRSRR